MKELKLSENFVNFFDKKIISAFALLSTFALNAVGLPIPIGGPTRVSPPLSLPNPVIDNLQTVLDNQYQPPYYPFFPDDYDSPTYLSNLYLFSNFYTIGSVICNPCNSDIMHFNISRNQMVDYTFTFVYATLLDNYFCTSFDGGLSWNYGPPVEKIIPLGGTVSQQVNASLGPGLRLAYAKNGRLDAAGWGGFDMIANPPYNTPMTHLLFTSSFNEGVSWNPIQKVISSTVAFIFQRPRVYNTGVGPREFYVISDPANPDLIHASTMYVVSPRIIFGNQYYLRSEDAGKTFTPPVLAYSMVNDPVWQANSFDPAYVSNPNYFIYGGWSLSSGIPVKYDTDILLLPISRRYPKVGSPTYQSSFFDTNFDQGVVRSLDNGLTFENVFYGTSTYDFPKNAYDPGFIDPENGPNIGSCAQPVVGLIDDATFQASNLTVSKTTGRIYMGYGVLAEALPTNIIFGTNFLQLNSSSDKGVTWSQGVKGNLTPTNISLGAQQVLAPRMIANLTGQILIAYYDFRNWSGVPGEDLLTTPLQTDAWLAVYNETEEPNGGSTGIGLDLVGEIRLTPESFNARIVNTSSPCGFYYTSAFVTGTPEGIRMVVNNKNELYVFYSVQQQGFASNVLENQYKGITIDTNEYNIILQQKFKFPTSSNN